MCRGGPSSAAGGTRAAGAAFQHGHRAGQGQEKEGILVREAGHEGRRLQVSSDLHVFAWIHRGGEKLLQKQSFQFPSLTSGHWSKRKEGEQKEG